MNKEVEEFFAAIKRLMDLSKGDVREMTPKEAITYHSGTAPKEIIVPRMGCECGALWDAGLKLHPDDKTELIICGMFHAGMGSRDGGVEILATSDTFWGINNLDTGECFIVKLVAEKKQITPEDYDWAYIVDIERDLKDAVQAVYECHHSAYHSENQDDIDPHDDIEGELVNMETHITNALDCLLVMKKFQPTVHKPKTNNSSQ